MTKCPCDKLNVKRPAPIKSVTERNDASSHMTGHFQGSDKRVWKLKTKITVTMLQ